MRRQITAVPYRLPDAHLFVDDIEAIVQGAVTSLGGSKVTAGSEGRTGATASHPYSGHGHLRDRQRRDG